MLRHWTPFNGSPNYVDRTKPRVTLNAKNVLLLNSVAYEELGRPAWVELMFDESNRTIGVKSSNEDRPSAFPVKRKPRMNHWQIFASPFCRHFKIRVDGTVMFNNVAVENEGVLALDIAKATTVGRGMR